MYSTHKIPCSPWLVFHREAIKMSQMVSGMVNAFLLWNDTLDIETLRGA